ncbi:uncharacterized protein adgrf3a isoform 2-T2 [Odontesthes bonariensis]
MLTSSCDGSLMGIKEIRNKMWIFAFLYLLCTDICQAADRDNSTQMYYAKMIIDKSAFKNVRDNLRAFMNNKLTIDNITITTECENKTDGMICNCSVGHKWSEEVCQTDGTCCGNGNCTFKNKQSQKCILDTTVGIDGSVTLEGEKYENCLKAAGSDDFIKCRDDLLKEIKKTFRTFKGFDSVTITEFRFGSIIAAFKITIVNAIDSQALMNKSQELVERLTGEINLETRGVVSMTMPNQPVHDSSTVEIKCTSEEDLGKEPEWSLVKQGKTYDIVNGTVSTLTSEHKQATVKLTQINELWEGKYICCYSQKSNSTNLYHKASATMDICHMPNIEAFTEPAFPLCEGTKQESVFLKATCRIQNSSENYDVTWKGATEDSHNGDQHSKTYTARAFVNCDQSSKNASKISCTFTNKCNQAKDTPVPIHIINDGKYCNIDGDWAITKPGFTAQLKCKEGIGFIKRTCNLNAKWEPERLDCVTEDLNLVRETAQLIDRGLGHLQNNTREVFSKFENFTKTNTISTYVNMNASVDVLSILEGKLGEIKENTVDTAVFLQLLSQRVPQKRCV